MKLKVWTKEQVAVAQKLVELSKDPFVNTDQFIDLMTTLKKLAGDGSKNFADFEKYPAQYASLLKSQAAENLQFYGPEHVILYIATVGNWSSPVARQVQSMAEGRAALAQSKNQTKDLPSPQVSNVSELKSIESQIAKEVLTELSWKDSDFKAILGAVKEFKKGVELYQQGNSLQSDVHINVATTVIVGLSSSNLGMRPVSKQEAYSLLSRASGGGLRIKQSEPEILLHAASALAKRSDVESIEKLHSYLTLRNSLEIAVQYPLMGDRAIEAMKILNLTPEEIFSGK